MDSDVASWRSDDLADSGVMNGGRAGNDADDPHEGIHAGWCHFADWLSKIAILIDFFP